MKSSIICFFRAGFFPADEERPGDARAAPGAAFGACGSCVPASGSRAEEERFDKPIGGSDRGAKDGSGVGTVGDADLIAAVGVDAAVGFAFAIAVTVAVGVLVIVGFAVAVGVTVATAAGVEKLVRIGGAVGIATIVSVGVRVAAGVDLGIGVDVGIGVNFGVGSGVDLGVAVALGVDLGEAVGVATGDADSAGSSDPTDSLSAAAGDSSFAAAGGVVTARAIRPGSDQPLACSPFANVACNRVCPCSLITGPSNFPRTILPEKLLVTSFPRRYQVSVPSPVAYPSMSRKPDQLASCATPR